MSAYMWSMSSRGRVSVARFMMPTVISANYVRNKTIGLRDGRAQRHEIETTTVGCAVKDWLQLEWPVPYRWVEPGSSSATTILVVLFSNSTPTFRPIPDQRHMQGPRSLHHNYCYL